MNLLKVYLILSILQAKDQALHFSFFLSLIQFNSIQFNSIQFNSIQFLRGLWGYSTLALASSPRQSVSVSVSVSVSAAPVVGRGYNKSQPQKARFIVVWSLGLVVVVVLAGPGSTLAPTPRLWVYPRTYPSPSLGWTLATNDKNKNIKKNSSNN